MANSHKKLNGGVSGSRPQTARSASTKKSATSSNEAIASHQRAKSSSRKKPSWDDTNHDLNVYKLPMKKLIQKQLQMMSKETLCKIANIEPPVRPNLRPYQEEILSPPVKKGKNMTQQQGSMFNSPSSAEDSSSAASTPSSVTSGSESDQSSTTPSPPETRRPHTTHIQVKPIVQTGKTTSKKPVVANQSQPTSAPAANPIPRRRSAAPVTTTAPPKSEEEEHNDLSYTSTNTSSSAPTSSELSYEPWLKHDSLLSPVLERSHEASIMGSPEPNERDNKSAPTTQQPLSFDEPTHEDQSRNLLNELHQSINSRSSSEFDSTTKQVLEAQAISFANAAQLTPLLTRLAEHLSEKPERAQKEQMFKSTVIESFGQAADQVKKLTKRVEEVEKENMDLKQTISQQHMDHERSLQMIMSQMKMMEMQMNQMMQMNRVNNNYAQPITNNIVSPSPSQHAYDPNMYSTSQPQSHPQHQRSQSPPRPIIIGQNGPTNLRTQQPMQVQGSRMSEVSVQLTGPPIQTPMPRSQSASITPIQPQQTVAWETYQKPQSQPQQPIQSRPSIQSSPMQHQQPSSSSHTQHLRQPSQSQPSQPAAFRSSTLTPTHHSAGSHDADEDFDDDDEIDEEAEQLPRSTRTLAPTPMSPGELEEAAEAARFERETAAAKAKLASMKANEALMHSAATTAAINQRPMTSSRTQTQTNQPMRRF